ncbi:MULTISPECIES: spore germination protein [Clostridium]|jgi:Bacillus/Clostridium GerA spore germination protein|uniref:spore germination protein n=1 Tax=Clostridium TaxID=1485 RepID=UPI0018AC213C|nr:MULTISPECIES: spore germination protein [Clostridium]MDB1932181.1 spore germination protein [Clostridium tertium]MDB1935807.1 spore germination protein [Clostridium tertium]MDB1969602.1 spore germination protein [Clostridium tertium]MDU1278915.1 spore germination protein [Clostridium sp.]MDU1567663.1 spore germination protein [Clostridium sp.]
MNNLEYVKEKLKNSFDVKYRPVQTVLGRATVVFIDDLCNAEMISEYVVSPLRGTGELEPKNGKIETIEQLIENSLDINAAGIAKDLDDAIMHILSGDPAVIFEGFEQILYVEAKGFPVRGVGTPETESVLKGPREGFNELIVNNVALIRRRIKNPDLKFEAVVVGEKSQTAVAVCYLEGVAPKDLVENVKEKVNNLDLRFILDTNYVEDALKNQKSFFDTVGYTEKPDEVSAKLLEGRVAVIVDGTPFVITVPYFFLENFQMPDDYYLNKYYTNFNRILRWLAFFVATLVPGLYVAIITYHFSMIPSLFMFRLAVSRAGVPFPTFLEVILMMLAFQFIKEAGLRLPQPIGGAMSIVSALILGDAAVGAGIASRITIIVVALSTLSYFLIPKLYGAVSFWAIVLVGFSAAFGIPGFLCGALLLLIQLAELDSIGYQFLFPVGSINEYRFKDVVLRGSLGKISKDFIKKGDEK